MNGPDAKKQNSGLKLRLFKYIHWILSLAIFILFWFLFRYGSFLRHFVKEMRYDVYIIALYAGLFSCFNAIFSSYNLGYSRIRNLVLSQCLSDFFSSAVVYVAVSFAWLQHISPFYFICTLIVQAVINYIWSRFGNQYYFRVTDRLQTVVIGRSEDDLERFQNIGGKPLERLIEVRKYIWYNGDDLSEIESKLKGFDGIFVLGVNDTLMSSLCKYCVANNVRGFFAPHIGDVIMSGAEHLKTFYSPVVSVCRSEKAPEYLFIKRLFDVLASVCGIILLSPLMLFIAVLIKIYDGGPVIYKQVRLTKDAKRFNIYKFRSMRVDAEKDGKARLSSGENDDRITPVGKFIRACRFDELPQLFNILKGDMTIVGPRPERPEIAAEYEKQLPEFALRLQVKAGLTGYAQVYGKYNTCPYEKLEFDLMYINKMNIITDFALMFDTVRILFKKESTEGFKSIEDKKSEEKVGSVQ